MTDKLLLAKVAGLPLGESRVNLHELFLAEAGAHVVEQVLDVVLGLGERLAAVGARRDQGHVVQTGLEVVVD